MPKHEWKHTLTVDSGTPTTASYRITYDQSSSLDTSIAANSNNSIVAFTLDTSILESLLMLADQDLTLRTNNNAAPGDTINLKANRPLIWNGEDGYFASPFANNVSVLYVTSTATVSASLKIYTLTDP
jgi:hypothetical protein